MDTFYSTNDEDFNCPTAEDAAQAIWDRGENKVGDMVTIYEGDCKKPLASETLPEVSELLRACAYDEFGDNADDWEFTPEQSKSLQEVMEKALNDWATENDMQPLFWKVNKSRAVQMRFTDESGNSESV